ncbi:Protein OS-9 [Podila minutissima]|uniref:Protein OS-9 homolog n=1 Tax=Podila minutissima TaxID=64525 RepID=A0A9P5VIS3_9FUNG|nr:Protein OS-9 [Podila minutissima]
MKPGTLSLSQAALIALAIWPAFLSPVQSFSGDFVFQDLLAHPQYDVKLLKQYLPMSAVEPERLKHGNVHRQQSPIEAPRIETTASDGRGQTEQTKQHDSSNLVMTTPDGQRWSCVIPPKPVIKVEEPPKKTPQEIVEEERQNIKRGLELLQPLTKGCLLRTIDYWTYEYCHEKHVRQYRAIKGVEGRYQEDPNGLRYVLGTFEAPPGIQGSTGNEASTQKSLSRQSGTMTNLVASQDKKYLVQRWENGDHCPLIGKPRKIEIQYQCAPVFSDQIRSVNEHSTCSYVIVIDSPSLCKDTAFQQAEAPEANNINCRPLVTDEQYKMVSEPGTIDSGLSGKDKGKVVSRNEANKPDEMTLHQELGSVMNGPEQDEDGRADLMVVLLQKMLEPYMSEPQKASLKKVQNALDKNAEIKVVGQDRNGQADHDTVVYLKKDSAKTASFVNEQDGENKGGDEEEKTLLDMFMEAFAEDFTPKQEEAAAKLLDTLIANLDINSLLTPEEAQDDTSEEDRKKGSK